MPTGIVWLLCQANIDQRVGWNAGVVTNTADPFDSPEEVIIWKVVNCVNRLAHWPIITKLFGMQMSQSRESVRPVANIVERSVALNLVLPQVWCSLRDAALTRLLG
jgi:hypothetical protein